MHIPSRHGSSKSTVAAWVRVPPPLHGPNRTAQRYHVPYTAHPDRT